MKLTLHSFEDLERLLALLGPKADPHYVVNNLLREPMPRASELVKDETPMRFESYEEDAAAFRAETEVETESTPSLPEEAAQAPELDADGRRWDERIDSSNKGLNKDGTWRARRNHGLSEDEVTRIKGELIVERVKDVVGQEAWDEAMASPEANETPAVTETHPLPTEVEETPDAGTRDYTDLIEKAKLIAGDQKDGLLDVLNAAKEFVKAHSPMAWTEFSQAVVPGKSVQGYEPAERRLILAAIEVYNAEHAS